MSANNIINLAQAAGLDPFKYCYESDVDAAIAELREGYYPDSDTLSRPGAPSEQRPAYYPVCRTPEELALAYALRPDGIVGGPILREAA